MSATRSLAAYVANANTDDLPPWTLHEAKRTLVNILAVSLSASADSGSHALIDWARDEAAAPRASVVGSSLRNERVQRRHGQRLPRPPAGLRRHTHFPTVLHPTAPVWPAVLAVAEERGTSGRETLAAFVLGAEAACRVAMSVHPWHYDMGWHITGTAGVFGAAAGAGRVLGLAADDMNTAARHRRDLRSRRAGGGSAATRRRCTPRRPLATACSPRASRRRASPARTTSWAVGRGFWQVLSPNGHSEEALLADLGSRWELGNNGLKPYANGVVSHPIQDAVITLRNEHGIAPEDVASIDAEVNPAGAGADEPRGAEAWTGGQVLVPALRRRGALVDGAGHDAQFSDARVADPVISAVRSKVSATIVESMREDEVRLSITLASGQVHSIYVEHATGSPENPMTDSALEAKYRSLAGEALPASQVEELLGAVWEMDSAPNVEQVARLMAI